jgi:hypothetical protein
MKSLTHTVLASELIKAEVQLNGYNEEFTIGEWDGATGGQPSPELWIESFNYRQGYRQGQAEYYDKKFAAGAF